MSEKKDNRKIQKTVINGITVFFVTEDSFLSMLGFENEALAENKKLAKVMCRYLQSEGFVNLVGDKPPEDNENEGGLV